jgi:hypothetical protein
MASRSVDNIITDTTKTILHHAVSRPQAPDPAHAFTILARLAKNPNIQFTKEFDIGIMFEMAVSQFSGVLNEYADNWSSAIDSSNPNIVESKIAELIWMNVVIYGIGGWKEGGDFNADFFLQAFHIFLRQKYVLLYLGCTLSPRPYFFHQSYEASALAPRICSSEHTWPTR